MLRNKLYQWSHIDSVDCKDELRRYKAFYKNYLRHVIMMENLCKDIIERLCDASNKARRFGLTTNQLKNRYPYLGHNEMYLERPAFDNSWLEPGNLVPYSYLESLADYMSKFCSLMRSHYLEVFKLTATKKIEDDLLEDFENRERRLLEQEDGSILTPNGRSL